MVKGNTARRVGRALIAALLLATANFAAAQSRPAVSVISVAFALQRTRRRGEGGSIQMPPMKSGLPSSTPLWRRMSYAVTVWKYTLGVTKPSR